MKIKRILSTNRNDFTAIYLCEHCAREEETYGYNDEHFHKRVIPAMICAACGKTGIAEDQPSAPRTITVRICECGADARPDFASCADSYCQRRAGEGSSYEDDVGKPERNY